MASDFTVLTQLGGPVVLDALRGFGPIFSSVVTDFSPEAADPFQTIDAVFPVSLTAKDVNPNASGSQGEEITPTKVQLTLNQWRKVDWTLTHKQRLEVSKYPQFFQQQVAEAMESLMGDFQLKLWQSAVSGGTHISTWDSANQTGSLDLLSSSFSPILTAAKALDDAKARPNGRSLYLGTAETYNLLSNPNLTRQNEAGTNETLRRGLINAGLFGFDVFKTYYAPSYTSGSANLAIQQAGLGVAVRPANAGVGTMTVIDPLSGFPVTMTVSQQDYQTRIDLGILFGVTVLRSNHVQIIDAGGSI